MHNTYLLINKLMCTKCCVNGQVIPQSRILLSPLLLSFFFFFESGFPTVAHLAWLKVMLLLSHSALEGWHYSGVSPHLNLAFNS